MIRVRPHVRSAAFGLLALLPFGAASVTRAQIVDSSQGAILVSPGPQTPSTQPVYIQPGTEPNMLGRQVEVRRRPRYALVIGGVAAFAVGYLGNVLMSASMNETFGCYYSCGSRYVDYQLLSYIPFVGTWLQLGNFDTGRYGGIAALHVLFGLLQAGGAVVALWGLLDKEEVYRPIALPWIDDHSAGVTFFGRM